MLRLDEAALNTDLSSCASQQAVESVQPEDAETEPESEDRVQEAPSLSLNPQTLRYCAL